MQYMTPGRRLFVIVNYAFLILLSLLCLLPLIHVLALSFSSSAAATAGYVKFWPVEFTTNSYQFVLKKPEFLASVWVSVKRVVLGTLVNMVLTVLLAYPLSKEVKAFRMRTIYVWFFFLTMLFGGGLIPWYMVIKETGLLNTIWALIIPGAVPVFNVILLLNFFRGLPKELEEASFIDGAGHWTTMWKIFVPLSLPALATITLFAMVGHWNSWFDGLILMNSPDNYPLQSYLQTVVIRRDLSLVSQSSLADLANVSDRTSKAAQIFMGALPILLVYPFLQRFFMKGIVLGSVKE
ncbi:carbohydrate ABC transporter permease [Paenibacillus spongiae]|uniref:Carbohydrate ABC transporter permease n=1 Tax=Paenibacillus spongiae TaxID=2909671 RepID=A0ABY5S777_9BACL|nr:carbohydrate ABC transporter permease [Paenibacillus spongiae]UVI29435.1 carbohydrate ABC transporter permease [Paenibacillus spongiae]